MELRHQNAAACTAQLPFSPTKTCDPKTPAHVTSHAVARETFVLPILARSLTHVPEHAQPAHLSLTPNNLIKNQDEGQKGSMEAETCERESA